MSISVLMDSELTSDISKTLTVIPRKCQLMGKKRKVDRECRVFNQTWTPKYVFTEVKGKAVCLVCREHIVVLKGYNLNCHYNTKYTEKYTNFTDAERAWTSEALLARLQKQQGFFTLQR